MALKDDRVGAVSCLEESNMKHGLNSEFLAYSGCVQTVKVWLLTSKVTNI